MSNPPATTTEQPPLPAGRENPRTAAKTQSSQRWTGHTQLTRAETLSVQSLACVLQMLRKTREVEPLKEIKQD